MAKTIKTRIQQKHDIEANWLKSNLVPLRGELIIYDSEVAEDGSLLELPADRTERYTYARYKIGDGKTVVNDLPFATKGIYSGSDLYDRADGHIGSNNTIGLPGARVERYWKAGDLYIDTSFKAIFKCTICGLGADGGDYWYAAWEKLGDISYTHPATHDVGMITGLADVATSGKYNDLIGTPTIPVVNNATLTIQKNGTTVKTFTANSATDITANITVPTKTSDLTNDSGFKTTDNDTTYTFATGDDNGQFKVTPKGGSVQHISIKGLGSAAYASKGTANGVAELDASGKVPTSQLPSYVDDVIEGTLNTFPTTGETGKIYVDTTTNKTYRWSGSAYAEISASLALGETSSTAYRGDRGKTAYDHSQTAHAPSNAQKNSDITKAEIEAKLTGTITSHTHTVTHPVTSVANKTGAVTLDRNDVGLGRVDNTADTEKSVASAAKLITARTIDGVSFDGLTDISHFGTCSTAAGTAAKTVSIIGFTLKTGARAIVKFNNTNSATNPTLNVNGTGAYSIIYKGNSIAAYPLFSIESLEATKTYEFVFTGSNYELVGSLGIDRFVDTTSNKSGYVKPGGDIYWTNGVGTVPGLSDKPDVYVSETAPQTTKVGSIWFDTSVVSTIQAEEASF